jgi:hypothetical protein
MNRNPNEPLRTATIVLFWLPLAATWFMMAVEGPYIAAIVARMPFAAQSLAAYGVATSLAWLIESPIMMLLSASVALVRGRSSYLGLRHFAFLMNALVTVGMLLLALPPVFAFVGQRLIGLPRDISDLAHAATTVLVLWPASIGYRRFYQGILVRHHLTRRVAYGTIVRLGTMSVTAAALAYSVRLPGAVLGAVALLSGVMAEAIASRWMARHLVRELMQRDDVSGTTLGLRGIARFYYPLALTSMLSMALGPLVTFGLGRGIAPIESLAVWPVVIATAFLFRSGGIAYQEVGIALTGSHGEHRALVTRTGLMLGAISSLALAAVAFTPLETVWLQTVSGLTPQLASFAVWPVRILILLPALDYVLSIQRSGWILAHRTSVITLATTIEAVVLALALFALVASTSLVAATCGAIATIMGRFAANAWLASRNAAVGGSRGTGVGGPSPA